MISSGVLIGLKTLTGLVSPLTIGIVGPLLALSRLKYAAARWTYRLGVASLAILGISALPVVAKLAALSLEGQYPPQAIAALPRVDVAVLLGGATRGVAEPRLEVELGTAGNRVVHAARLYRAGKVRKILVSAGGLAWNGTAVAEADAIAAVLMEFGVPQVDLVLERHSRTTAENAEQSQRVWAEQRFTSGLLVTSALHMPRALGLFRRVGLDLVPATTDVTVTWPIVGGPLDLIPNATSLVLFGNALHEWIAIAFDRASRIFSQQSFR